MKEAQMYARAIKKLTRIDVLQETRKREVVEHRSVLVHILKEVEKYKLYEIRDFFRANGKKYDHSTALFAARQYEMYSKYNPELRKLYEKLTGLKNADYMKKKLISKYVDELEKYQVEYLLAVLEKSDDIKNN
jgi:hypothetical protein